MANEVEEPIELDAKPGETKSQAFVRLANPRVSSALKRIELIGNLSNRSSYEYTEQQIEKIEAALLESVSHTINKFRRVKDKPAFEL
jgi:hypothetical protein